MADLSKALRLIKEIEQKNHQAYLVGGFVRDYYLRIPSNDIDITTSAKPTEMMRLFDTIPTGLKYGTVTVHFEGENFEVTTFRIEGGYSDFRHPGSVTYTMDVNNDVQRRDFTINGLLMDKNKKIIDLVGGLADIKAKTIRTIGNPNDRFKEDALRILRAFYFVAKLGYNIEEKTFRAISKDKDLLREVSNERILQEIQKMLKQPYLKDAFELMVKTRVNACLPGLARGIEFISKLDKMPYSDTFFVICFYLNDGIVDSEWRFPGHIRQKLTSATNLAKKTQFITYVEIYEYGLEVCLLANKALTFLGVTTPKDKLIKELAEKIPVKSDLDLALRSESIIAIANKKPGAWLSSFKKQLINKILTGKLGNNKEDIEKDLKSFLEGVK